MRVVEGAFAFQDGAIAISFGGRARPIAVQLDAHGVISTERRLQLWQKHSEAIVLLSENRILSQECRDEAIARLFRKIADGILEKSEGSFRSVGTRSELEAWGRKIRIAESE